MRAVLPDFLPQPKIGPNVYTTENSKLTYLDFPLRCACCYLGQWPLENPRWCQLREMRDARQASNMEQMLRSYAASRGPARLDHKALHPWPFLPLHSQEGGDVFV